VRFLATKQSTAVIVMMTAFLCRAPGSTPPTKSDYEAPVRLPTVKATTKVHTVADLQRLADKGDAAACFELGTRYLDGDGVAIDTARAMVYLEKAARSGNGRAAFRIGKIAHDGTHGLQDYERCLEFYTLAAQAGEMEAQHNIGAMLVSARGVKRDYVEGLAWLIVATRAGDDSGVEAQVRQHLVKYPAKIKEGESRAEDILKDLRRAIVRAELASAPAKKPVVVAPPAVDRSRPVVIPMEKPRMEMTAPAPLPPPRAPTAK
jgi:uncharacterized protein